MAKTLEFRGIGKSYPGVRALDNVNFKVESGKVLGEFRPTGLQPQFLSKFKSHNVEYPAFMQKARPGIDWEEGD